MKNSSPLNVRFLFLQLLVIASFIMFYIALTDPELYLIATDGFYHISQEPWYAQPWVWALVLAGITLLFFLITGGTDPEKVESDSEEGTTHE